MLGVIMVLNVYFVIIPGQRELVKAKQEGRTPDPKYGAMGRQRSVHNTYFTLPVLFTMISNHYAGLYGHEWNWVLLITISVAGALIPEFTKVFVSTNSGHVKEVTNCSRHGGASLNILSGFVAGNFSAFWMGLCILVLMWVSYYFSQNPALLSIMPEKFLFAAPIFAFGLVAFGFLGMGPVTIAVDSYGPVTDNAQSVYELSQIEGRPGIAGEIERDFGFKPDFENAKYQLEKGDGAGNTFKATAKPVLIGTAVVGATTMVFGIIILLENLFGQVIPKLSIVQPEIILGLIMGGSVIYWFTGASCQAVVTGAYRAVVYIKENMKLDAATAAKGWVGYHIALNEGRESLAGFEALKQTLARFTAAHTKAELFALAQEHRLLIAPVATTAEIAMIH